VRKRVFLGSSLRDLIKRERKVAQKGGGDLKRANCVVDRRVPGDDHKDD